MRFLYVLAVSCSLWFVGAAQLRAADSSSGCGPGWYIFKDTSIVSSSLRATTNGFLWPTTTVGMTLGTSNCAKHSIVLQQKAALHFASVTYNDLQISIASGRGEHLQALAQTLGCNWSVQKEFEQVLKQNYGQVFPTDAGTPDELVGNVVEQIHQNPVLSASCQAHMG